MKFKNILAVITIICIILFSGCGSEPSDVSETSSSLETNPGESANTSDKNDTPGNIDEKHFVLENGGCKLNAVYTYIKDGKAHPAVLLIAGSGPSDHDETVGCLKPFEDIARGLAWLGQIATELAASNGGVDGMILFNSSARHLADIACNPICRNDKESYIAYADAAKSVSDTTAKGYYYYGASDYYWASYNQLNVTNNISESNIKTLIINSTFDKQSFDADIDLWAALFSDSENVSICVFDDISHFGYKIDTADPSSIFTHADFPNEVISLFADFIKRN